MEINLHKLIYILLYFRHYVLPNVNKTFPKTMSKHHIFDTYKIVHYFLILLHC